VAHAVRAPQLLLSLRAAGLNFKAYAEQSSPLGFTPKSLVKMGELSALKYLIELFEQGSSYSCDRMRSLNRLLTGL